MFFLDRDHIFAQSIMEGDYLGGSINYIQISRYTQYMSLVKIAITNDIFEEP